jgi:hypothetical protein
MLPAPCSLLHAPCSLHASCLLLAAFCPLRNLCFWLLLCFWLQCAVAGGRRQAGLYIAQPAASSLQHSKAHKAKGNAKAKEARVAVVKSTGTVKSKGRHKGKRATINLRSSPFAFVLHSPAQARRSWATFAFAVQNKSAPN